MPHRPQDGPLAPPIPTGIFGGTLDPVHFGHLRTAEETREAAGLKEIWFIPAAHPPHKGKETVTPFHHRLEMTRLAALDNSNFTVLDIEAARPGPSFSVDTMKELHSLHGRERAFFFIMGSDAFLEIEMWHSYRNLVDYCSVIIMGRDTGDFHPAEAIIKRSWPQFERIASGKFIDPDGKTIVFQLVTHLEISATDIRARVRAGQSVRYLVPEKVREYMETNRLYIEDYATELPTQSTTSFLPPDDQLKEPDSECERAVAIARAIHNCKGEDIVLLDIRGMSAIADFFIIAHGRSTRHVEGMASKMRRQLREQKIRCRGIEGEDEAKWILMDYDDCVVHLFYQPVRAFYDLEGLWSDAPRIRWQDDSPGASRRVATSRSDNTVHG